MFERFTDRARRVVVLAQEEARLLNHNYIGTEHILLGLLNEGEGIAAKALESLGINLSGVREQVVEIIGQGAQAPSGHIPFTPRAKKVLELSLREALQLGHSYIGTEHILLGLVREGQGVAAKVLKGLGAELQKVREAVMKLLPESSEGEERAHAIASEPGRETTISGSQLGRPPQTTCPHRSDRLAYHRAEIMESGGTKPWPTIVVTCTLCHTTISVLPDGAPANDPEEERPV
jgi:ATP-dependent Clp protease ATP-binding subunit ClpC